MSRHSSRIASNILTLTHRYIEATVQMPVMDGPTATRRIREELGLKTLPIIGLTAGVLESELAEARSAGLYDIVPKPLDLEHLVDCIRQWAKPKAVTPGDEPGTDTIKAGIFPTISGIDAGKAE
jgi:CheY-like chemotaxis protein